MELHSMSPSRLALQAAITAYANAERIAKDAILAYDVQKAELANSIAEFEKFSDIDSQSASLTAARVKARIKGNWRDNELAEGHDANMSKAARNLRSARTARRKAQEQLEDDRGALSQLEAERDEAQSDVEALAIKRTDAIELVLAEVGATLLSRAREAEMKAAALRAELMAMDGLHIVSAGKMRRVLADQSIAASRDIVQWLRAPLPESAPSHEQRSLWRAFAQALETDAEAALDDEDVQTAAAAMPRPAGASMPPQIPWEQTAAYRGEAAQAALVSPANATGVGLRPNAPAAEPRWEESAARRAAWAKPHGELMQRYEDSEAYRHERAQFSTKT